MLNDTKLRGLKARPTVYRVADSNGLCIEVRPTGAKYWRYRFRIAGKPSMATLGEYPSMSLTNARFEREKARALVKGGANPVHVSHAMKATQEEKASNTFGVIANELMLQRSKRLSPGSVERERRLIDKDLAPIANTPITDVTPQALLAALRKVEQRGAIETAHRARSMASTVFRYAIASGRAERNPASDLAGALAQPESTHFSSVTEPKEVGPLLQVLYAYTGTPQVAAAIKLAPLTFVRPGELRAAKWADIDFDAAEWRYTTSKTKTPHIVPLSTQAVTILRDLHPITKRSAYVFPGARSAARPMSENAVNAALKTMGIDSDTMTGHGFRAMARTILDEVLGFRPDIIEHQLAHAVKDPLGRAYNRTAHLPERKAMMQKWSDYLDKLRSDRVVGESA